MKKIEFIWRHILFETIEKRTIRFQQQELATHFGISSSTVNAAIAPIARLGAIHVGGRGFTVVDYEKILYHWANHRLLGRDIVAQLFVNLPIRDIEGMLPTEVIPTAYTAVRERFTEPPADYDKIYCYTHDPTAVTARFAKEIKRGNPNLFLLRADPHLRDYRNTVTLGHLFVDLWNLSDWYAKDFVRIVKEEIDGLLS